MITDYQQIDCKTKISLLVFCNEQDHDFIWILTVWKCYTDRKFLKVKHNFVEHLKDIVIFSAKDSFKRNECPLISPLDGLSLLFLLVYLISKGPSELVIIMYSKENNWREPGECFFSLRYLSKDTRVGIND